MRVAGIIAEYNPLHNGHVYHMAQTMRKSGCDALVICMSASFTQRGEAACLDKWTRARLALLSGADIVLELPALYAVRSADVFAYGGVSILDGIGCDVLSFGCDTAPSIPLKIADLRDNEPEAVSRKIREGLERGLPYVRAQGESWAAYLGLDPETLSAPNAILAAEYIRSLRKRKSRMEPLAVARIGSGYNDSSVHPYASASAVRLSWRSGSAEWKTAVPEYTREALESSTGDHPLDDLVLFSLRNRTAEELSGIADMGEGLERRILKTAQQAGSIDALLEGIKSKRYTRARISRILTQTLLGITRPFAAEHTEPAYARVLGMREGAGRIIREMRERGPLPIVTDPMALRGDPVFQMECRATDLWALGRCAPGERTAAQDLTRPFVILRK